MTDYDTSRRIGDVDAAEGTAWFDPDNPPRDVPLRRWQQLVDDAARLIDGGLIARDASLGWAAQDLFGCDRDKPFARIDQMGLVWFIKGGRVIELTASTAVIETEAGARQTYRRNLCGPGRVLVWELARRLQS